MTVMMVEAGMFFYVKPCFGSTKAANTLCRQLFVYGFSVANVLKSSIKLSKLITLFLKVVNMLRKSTYFKKNIAIT